MAKELIVFYGIYRVAPTELRAFSKTVIVEVIDSEVALPSQVIGNVSDVLSSITNEIILLNQQYDVFSVNWYKVERHLIDELK